MRLEPNILMMIPTAALLSLVVSPGFAQGPPVTVRASIGDRGQHADDRSSRIRFSKNGRYVVFTSKATNLVPWDENGEADSFLVDLLTHRRALVSMTWDGVQGNGAANGVQITDDGSAICFSSWATNYVWNDTNGSQDVFHRDLMTGEVTRISVASDGTEGNDGVGDFDMTPDARFIAFSSHASNMVDADTNGWPDVFVHDRETGITERVSISSNGAQGDFPSWNPSISANGRFVAFTSQARNLVDDDTNIWEDVFVHDRQTGETTRVSESSSGEEGNGSSGWNGTDISANGRFITFGSGASNLVEDDTNQKWDVFVHDLWTRETERVSVSSSGEQGSGDGSTISDDGRYVVFWSTATTFDSRDNNSHGDVYVHDRLKRTTTLVSVSTDGEVSNDVSVWPSISGNGRFIGFESDATNLAPNDDNRRRDVFIHLREW